MSHPLYDIPLKKIDGTASTLNEYKDYVLLIVNVASKCGFTPQYANLEALYEAHREQKFAVLGFPANDFAGQEPGSDAEIAAFCDSSYSVTFPMFSKITVTGEDKHPLYTQLITACPQTEGRTEFEAMLRKYDTEPTLSPEVVWNFEKFLMGRNGQILGRYAPDMSVEAEPLCSLIASALSAH